MIFWKYSERTGEHSLIFRNCCERAGEHSDKPGVFRTDWIATALCRHFICLSNILCITSRYKSRWSYKPIFFTSSLFTLQQKSRTMEIWSHYFHAYINVCVFTVSENLTIVHYSLLYFMKERPILCLLRILPNYQKVCSILKAFILYCVWTYYSIQQDTISVHPRIYYLFTGTFLTRFVP
jgi:hypothetical protein